MSVVIKEKVQSSGRRIIYSEEPHWCEVDEVAYLEKKLLGVFHDDKLVLSWLTEDLNGQVKSALYEYVRFREDLCRDNNDFIQLERWFIEDYPEYIRLYSCYFKDVEYDSNRFTREDGIEFELLIANDCYGGVVEPYLYGRSLCGKYGKFNELAYQDKNGFWYFQGHERLLPSELINAYNYIKSLGMAFDLEDADNAYVIDLYDLYEERP